MLVFAGNVMHSGILVESGTRCALVASFSRPEPGIVMADATSDIISRHLSRCAGRDEAIVCLAIWAL